MQRQGNDHTAEIVAHQRIERRSIFQTADLLHLRKVLVLLSQRILTGAVETCGAVVALVDCDGLLARAAVAGYRVNAHGVVSGHYSELHQRVRH